MSVLRWWLWPVALVAAGCSGKPSPETVWVGQLLSLKGPDRTAGAHARQGAELAVEESQAAGQTAAGRPLGALHVDSGDDPTAVQAETVRLLTVNRAAALIAGFDPVLTERLLRANQPYGVPVVVPGELPGPADSPGVLSLGAAPSVRGRLLARYAANDLGGRRAAVLTDSRRPVAAAVASAFLKAWPRGGESSVEEWTFTSAAERDESVARLIRAAPSVVLLACSLDDFRALRPRLTEALPKVPLVYGGEDGGAAPLRAELETYPDVYLATAYDADQLSEAGRDFARRYEERHKEPPDLYAAQAYDAARLLLGALARAGSDNKDALVKEVAGLEQFDGVTGPIRWKDREPRRRVFLVELKNHRAKVVRTIEPEEN